MAKGINSVAGSGYGKDHMISPKIRQAQLTPDNQLNGKIRIYLMSQDKSRSERQILFMSQDQANSSPPHMAQMMLQGQLKKPQSNTNHEQTDCLESR